MSYTITSTENEKIKLAPENIVEEILQNIIMILSTPKYSAPQARNFGLASRFVDKPTPAAEALIVAEILDAIEEYEPRAEVLNVSFERNEMIGKIIPRVEVDIHGE